MGVDGRSYNLLKSFAGSSSRTHCNKHGHLKIVVGRLLSFLGRPLFRGRKSNSCICWEALFMHEVPVHVNATMEEEVGQAVSFSKPQSRGDCMPWKQGLCWSVSKQLRFCIFLQTWVIRPHEFFFFQTRNIHTFFTPSNFWKHCRLLQA